MSTSTQPQGPFETLREEISNVFSREDRFRAFLNSLRQSGLALRNFEAVVPELAIGGGFGKGDVFSNPATLFAALSDSEKVRLKRHYLAALESGEQKFPQLKLEFPEEFR
jgi:hypothetical protein